MVRHRLRRTVSFRHRRGPVRQTLYLLIGIAVFTSAIPAAALSVSAARAGSDAYDQRTALLGALGGRRARALVNTGEAALPVAVGAVAGLAASLWILSRRLTDLHLVPLLPHEDTFDGLATFVGRTLRLFIVQAGSGDPAVSAQEPALHSPPRCGPRHAILESAGTDDWRREIVVSFGLELGEDPGPRPVSLPAARQ
ncbi:hypothetical protein GTW69_06775 [Streptomyces sp. SID7760]|nr:hypothetical protein [Streptomyces sp. SID7760]